MSTNSRKVPRQESPTPEGQNTSPAFRSDDILANAAMLYYKDGLTQNEIALRMRVSRATVVNYLRLAREHNIVDIRINGRSFASSSLSKELRDKFGLTDVYVADFCPHAAGASATHATEINRHVARVGAAALYEILQPGEIVGVAWGETMQFLSEAVPRRAIENLTVCQMIGSMDSPLVSSAESCAIRISSRLGAECYTLHAPAILTTKELAEALRNEPVIKNQLKKFGAFDRTIFSVGSCDPSAFTVQSSITSKSDFKWYKKQGAVAVLCGRFIDAQGDHIKGEMDTRLIGVTLAQVKAKASGILVAGGPGKTCAIHATLKGGYASHLVTDDATARSLMAMGGKDS